MKRTTVKLPDRVDAMLRHEAERRGITISEITREAIENHLDARVHASGQQGPGEAEGPTSPKGSKKS